MLRNHTLETDAQRVAILSLDMQGNTVNVLNSELIEELHTTIKRLHAMKEVKGLIIKSAKPKQFIAGANIEEIEAITNSSQAEEKAHLGQSLMTAIESLPFPSVAVIDGPCLGGGLELALACTYRVAGEGAHVKLALPEVKLGIIPGFGGTQRLPKLVGLRRALDLILTGRNLDGKQAYRLGLVDDLAASEILEKEAEALLLKSPRMKRPSRMAWLEKWITKIPFVRKYLFKEARKRVVFETKGFYPAPLIAIDVLSETSAARNSDGYDLEAKKVSELIASNVSKSLIRVFQATESIRKERFTEAPKAIHKVAQIGAGVMGGGIAQLVSSKGKSVRMIDISTESLAKAMGVVHDLNQKEVQKRRISALEAHRRYSLVAPATSMTGLGRADLVIEAVAEKMEVKKKVFAQVSQKVRPETILATNTSALSISEIASAATHPERVVGLHFFNPVHKMPLVEIIRGRETSESAVATVHAFAISLGKTPIVVKDSPGFLVNRILGICLGEACLAAEEGIPIPDIETSLRSFGMPMGPFELMDEIGIDIADEVGMHLKSSFPYFPPASQLLGAVRKEGRLGKKSGKGFYLHKRGKKEFDEAAIGRLIRISVRDSSWKIGGGQYGSLADRFVLLMINEAARCLEEGVVKSARDIDIGMVFGTGFAPFRGGLLAFANHRTLADVDVVLKDLARNYGERFEPSRMVRELALKGETF